MKASLFVSAACLAFAAGTAPAEILLDEGFNSAVPPTGWTAVVTNEFTWEFGDYEPFEGAGYATCLYDENYTGTQDEWLVSPVLNTSYASATLGGATNGSVYWGKPPDQGGTYDNYDLEVWIILGDGVNDGDDILLGKLDDFWVESYVWEDFSYDLTGLFTPGEDFRIGFRYYGYDGAQGSIDGILVTAIPTPGAIALLGLAGLVGSRRRR